MGGDYFVFGKYNRCYYLIIAACRPLGGAEQQGFVCIFCFAENNCFDAVQPASTKLPPAA